MQPRPDTEDVVPRAVGRTVQRHADLPLALAERRLKRLQHVQGGSHIGDVPLLGQCHLQTLEIARRLVHVGFLHLDQNDPRGGVHGDRARRGGLAHHLAVHLAFRGNVDDDVALNRGLTAEAASLLQAAHTVIAFLDRVPFRQRVGRDGDAVLGEVAIGRRDLAFRTDAAPAADAVEIDAKLPRGGQDGRADGKAAAFGRWRKDDEGVGRHFSRSFEAADTVAYLCAASRVGTPAARGGWSGRSPRALVAAPRTSPQRRRTGSRRASLVYGGPDP